MVGTSRGEAVTVTEVSMPGPRIPNLVQSQGGGGRSTTFAIGTAANSEPWAGVRPRRRSALLSNAGTTVDIHASDALDGRPIALSSRVSLPDRPAPFDIVNLRPFSYPSVGRNPIKVPS